MIAFPFRCCYWLCSLLPSVIRLRSILARKKLLVRYCTRYTDSSTAYLVPCSAFALIARCRSFRKYRKSHAGKENGFGSGRRLRSLFKASSTRYGDSSFDQIVPSHYLGEYGIYYEDLYHLVLPLHDVRSFQELVRSKTHRIW
jgi:hypothetical protein